MGHTEATKDSTQGSKEGTGHGAGAVYDFWKGHKQVSLSPLHSGWVQEPQWALSHRCSETLAYL